MRVACPGPSTNPLEICMMYVSQYQLENQHKDDQDPDDLMYCSERAILNIQNTEGHGECKANNADPRGNYLEHPVESEGIEESEQGDAKGEQDDEGAAEADGMKKYERSNRPWQGSHVKVCCSGKGGDGSRSGPSRCHVNKKCAFGGSHSIIPSSAKFALRTVGGVLLNIRVQGRGRYWLARSDCVDPRLFR